MGQSVYPQLNQVYLYSLSGQPAAEMCLVRGGAVFYLQSLLRRNPAPCRGLDQEIGRSSIGGGAVVCSVAAGRPGVEATESKIAKKAQRVLTANEVKETT